MGDNAWFLLCQILARTLQTEQGQESGQGQELTQLSKHCKTDLLHVLLKHPCTVSHIPMLMLLTHNNNDVWSVNSNRTILQHNRKAMSLTSLSPPWLMHSTHCVLYDAKSLHSMSSAQNSTRWKVMNSLYGCCDFQSCAEVQMACICYGPI